MTAMYFLAEADEPVALEDEGILHEELGVQSNNIDNLKGLQKQASDAAEHSLSWIGSQMQTINKKDFGAEAAEAFATKVLTSIAEDFAKRRTATIGDLQAKMKTLSDEADETDSEEYKTKLASAQADMQSVHQLGEEEATGKAALDAVDEAEDAESDLFEQSVNAISSSTEAMLTYATAIHEMQDKVGLNANETAAEAARTTRLSQRMNDAAEDAQGVADLIIKEFYAAVREHVEKQQAAAKAAASRVRLFLQKSTARETLWTPQIFAMGMMAAFAGVLTVRMLAQVRPQSSTINPAPLLG